MSSQSQDKSSREERRRMYIKREGYNERHGMYDSHSMSGSPYYDYYPQELEKRKHKKPLINRKDKKKAKTQKKSSPKKCPQDKILNPLSNRCIKKSGKLAKTLKKQNKL